MCFFKPVTDHLLTSWNILGRVRTGEKGQMIAAPCELCLFKISLGFCCGGGGPGYKILNPPHKEKNDSGKGLFLQFSSVAG